MLKKKTLFFLGIWLIVVPFLGFPDTIRKIIIVATGFAVSVLAYFLVKAKRAGGFSLFSFKDQTTNIQE